MSDTAWRDQWRGTLLGTALGDAVGAPFEGSRAVDRRQVQRWLDADTALTWTAALACFLSRPDDPVEVVTTAVCLGGDTDTIAAMAGAQVGAHLGATALPEHLLERLEARDELVALADQLAEC